MNNETGSRFESALERAQFTFPAMFRTPTKAEIQSLCNRSRLALEKLIESESAKTGLGLFQIRLVAKLLGAALKQLPPDANVSAFSAPIMARLFVGVDDWFAAQDSPCILFPSIPKSYELRICRDAIEAAGRLADWCDKAEADAKAEIAAEAKAASTTRTYFVAASLRESPAEAALSEIEKFCFDLWQANPRITWGDVAGGLHKQREHKMSISGVKNAARRHARRTGATLRKGRPGRGTRN